MIASHYRLEQWEAAPVVHKGRLIAHYLHRIIRESYLMELASEGKDGSKNDGGYKAMMASMGI